MFRFLPPALATPTMATAANAQDTACPLTDDARTSVRFLACIGENGRRGAGGAFARSRTDRGERVTT